jgi:hypothetical protein
LGRSHELYPPALDLIFFVFAGWATRRQQEVIDYLRTENQILKEKLGKSRSTTINEDVLA